MISVIIPVSKEDFRNGLISKIENSLNKSKCSEEFEMVLVINSYLYGRVRAKNYGASKAKGETLVFLDCDCEVSDNLLQEISDKSKNDFFVGGGVKYVKLSRYSPGILCGMFILGLYLLIHQITIGAFWIRKTDFNRLNGFRHTVYDDIDFALRLKSLAKQTGRKFESLKNSSIIWSTRKFDEYGDWHWIMGYRACNFQETTSHMMIS